MVRAVSPGALFVSAKAAARFACSRTVVVASAAAAPGMLGGTGILLLGGGALVVYGSFNPYLRRLGRRYLSLGSRYLRRLASRYLSLGSRFPLDRLRVKAQHASNKGARIQHNKRQKLYKKNFLAGHR